MIDNRVLQALHSYCKTNRHFQYLQRWLSFNLKAFEVSQSLDV